MAGTRNQLDWSLGLLVCAVSAAVGLLAGVDPKLAIAASLSILFVLVILSDLSAGLALFTFLSLVALVPVGAGPAVSFLKAVGFLLLLSWLATIIRRESAPADFISSHQGLAYVVILFLGWIALSPLWADEPGSALTFLYRLALNAVLFVIVFTAVQRRRDLVSVMTAFVLGASVAAAYGLTQPSSASEVERLAGTLGNANELAAILVVGVVFSCGLLMSKPTPAVRLIAIGGFSISLFGVLLTLSRTGLVALGAACIAALLFSGRWRARALPIVLVVLTLGIGYFVAIASPEARDRVTNLSGGGGTGRVDLWTVAWRMVEAEPLTGVGAGNFRLSAIDYLLQPGALERSDLIVTDPKVAHNTYLEIWAELGIVGIALFISMLVICLSCVWKAIRNFARRRERSMEILSRTLLVALIALLVADFFASEQFQKALWLLLALCPAVLAMSVREERPCAE